LEDQPKIVRNIPKMAHAYADEWLKMIVIPGVSQKAQDIVRNHFVNGFLAGAGALTNRETLNEWKVRMEEQIPRPGQIAIIPKPGLEIVK